MKLWHRRPPLPESDGDSVTTLFYPAPRNDQVDQQAPLIACLCFAALALLLGVTAAALELVDVYKVKGAWNEEEGKGFGLTVEFGSLAYSKRSVYQIR